MAGAERRTGDCDNIHSFQMQSEIVAEGNGFSSHRIELAIDLSELQEGIEGKGSEGMRVKVIN